MRSRLVMVVLASLLTAGCWDRVEINDFAFALGTAVDKEDDLYRVSVQMALPGRLGTLGRGGGGTKAGEKNWYMDSAAERSPREAVTTLQQSLPRRLNFSHRRVFMVGEELAREGIGTLLDPVARVPQNRMTAFLSVARGRAVDVLNADAPIEQFPAEMVRELTQAVMRRPTTLTTFIGQILETGVDPIAAVFETYHTAAGSDSLSYQGIRLAGMGLFRDANLVGILEGPQAQGLLLAMGLASDPSIAVPAPWGDFIIVVRLHETTAQLVPLLHGDRVSARVRIQAKFSLQENTSPTPIHSRGISGRLKPALEGQVRQMAEAAIKEAQAAGADPLGIGHAIHSADPAYWRRIQPSWERLYAKMKVQVEVALQLEHTGGIIQPVTGKGGHR